MNTKRISYRETTAQQRKLLFEVWEATGNVTLACRKAHVGRGTFYYWKPRFEKYGYKGLEEFESRAPKNPYRTSVDVDQKVVAMRRKHPDWGKQRIADELAKANNWVPLIAPQTVRRILKDAGLWEAVEAASKKSRSRQVVERRKSQDKPSM
jgi:transposase